MNRYVYLYELDSTVSSDVGIKAGRNALLEETLERGNKVVITFNQLVDSKALVGLMQDEKTYKLMLQLFKNGSIKVVRYHNGSEEVRTAAQYLLNVLESSRKNTNESNKDKFLFGAIPIKRECTEEIELLYRAIMYSDISLIESNPILRRYVNIILEISQNSKCYIDGKNKDGQMKFINILTEIMKGDEKVKSQIEGDTKKIYEKAIKLLCDIKEKNEIKDPNARSGWLGQIEKNTQEDKVVKDFAKYIIFLCYNYVVEDGIKDVCKRYILDEETSLPNDYCTRMNRYFAAPEVATSIWGETQKNAPDKWMKIKLITTVHVLDEMQWFRKRVEKRAKQEEKNKIYEEDEKKDLVYWRLMRGVLMLLSMVMAFVYGALFYGIDALSGWWKGVMKSGVQSAVSVFSETVIYAIITTVTFAVVMAIYKMAKKAILKKCKVNIEIPDFAESFFNLMKGFRDIIVIVVFKIEKLVARKVVE